MMTKPKDRQPDLFKARLVFSAVVGLVLLGHVQGWFELDEVALALLAIAALPWVGLFLSSFKAFGIEAELREVRQTAEAAKTTSEEARNTSLDAAQRLDLEAMPTTDGKRISQSIQNDAEALFSIGKEYVETRQRMKSGDERTAEMTRLFHMMMETSRGLGAASAEVAAELVADTPDPGRVLAALAYAYESPGSASVSQLLTAIENARQPFVQYWGLMALRKLTKVEGIRTWSAAEVARFKQLEYAFRPGTDRAWVFERIDRLFGGNG